jgi:zinc transport system substrate-binding protein
MTKRLLLFLLMLLPVPVVAEALRVFVSVPPQKTFVEKVGGEHVEVHAMVPPGHNPGTYDPSPQQVAALARTHLYLRVGVPFESAWMERIRSANPDMRVVDGRQGMDLRVLERHHHGDAHGHDHGDDPHGHHRAPDPHVWTSPPRVKQMARTIRDALAGLDPAHAADFERNYEVFAAELDALDRDIRARLAGLPNRRFMVFHPAWGYFADTYGLTQVPIEHEGKQPGARALAELIEMARADDIRVVFVQPQFDRRNAEQIARAIGGRVVAIDPLAADYTDNLRQAAAAIAQALRR